MNNNSLINIISIDYGQEIRKLQYHYPSGFQYSNTLGGMASVIDLIQRKAIYQYAMDRHQTFDDTTGEAVTELRRWLQIDISEIAVLSCDKRMLMVAPEFITSSQRTGGVLRPHTPTAVISDQELITHSHFAERNTHTLNAIYQSFMASLPTGLTFFTLLRDECLRLTLYELSNTLRMLSEVFFDKPDQLEMIALVYFHAAVCEESCATDLAKIHDSRSAPIAVNPQKIKAAWFAEIEKYLQLRPQLRRLIEEYIFFAFYNQWMAFPIRTSG
ncbi:hypothetical protein FD644_01555 [Serratia fonticola]|uniref:hypothetical protein n=1 Tax=Serratia fonticola TaxID=47917 RepID=UPI0008FD37BA|nr:hypothetical protein [Serratia fonticola]QCR59109.1 hypothetical protein FD644_01555 [Serratia fonticola]